jgi:hypothetical protein
MKEFIGIYLLRYEGESITSHDVFIYMRYFFTLKGKYPAFEKINWEQWINGTGYSPVHLSFSSKSLTDLFQLVSLFKSKSAGFDSQFQQLISNHSVLSTKLQTIFFQEIRENDPGKPERAAALDLQFNLSQGLNNFEVLVPWFLYCLRSGYE